MSSKLSFRKSENPITVPLLSNDDIEGINNLDRSLDEEIEREESQRSFDSQVNEQLRQRWWDKINWDDLLSYHTTKIVIIRDKYPGMLYYFFILCSIVYIFYLLAQGEGIYISDNIVGSVASALWMPKNGLKGPFPYCSSQCTSYNFESGCDCLFWDDLDLLYPAEQEDTIFISTGVSFLNNQTKGSPCNGAGNPCGPVWDNTINRTISYRLLQPEAFLLELFHEAIAPTFYQQSLVPKGIFHEQPSKWQRTNLDLWGQVIDQQGKAIYNSEPGQLDTFPLQTLFDATGYDFSSNEQKQGLMQVFIAYGDCVELVNGNKDKASKEMCNKVSGTLGKLHENINYYQLRATWFPTDVAFLQKTSYSVDGTSRTLKNQTGVRITFIVLGQVFQLSAPHVLQTIVSRYILLTLIVLIVDSLVLWLLPGKHLYSSAKYEKSENISDIRKTLGQMTSLKEKIKNIEKVARYRPIANVITILNDIRNTVNEQEFDQLVLAAMRVFFYDLNSVDLARQMVEYIIHEESLVIAYIMIGELKEAYLLAAKMGSFELVQKVKLSALSSISLGQNATSAKRVLALADQYLSQYGIVEKTTTNTTIPTSTNSIN
eukprot:TRINITY_DN7260_c0_g5_i1.p1 TRINITY_DN7260_c0_g5~~TRINITY_DN7260_c0_g5_i1.p1  ORF type:complete len:601 (-),score=88.25 TRINITY_DN7260_c0_g5_i1:81-1883(-)